MLNFDQLTGLISAYWESSFEKQPNQGSELFKGVTMFALTIS